MWWTRACVLFYLVVMALAIVAFAYIGEWSAKTGGVLAGMAFFAAIFAFVSLIIWVANKLYDLDEHPLYFG